MLLTNQLFSGRQIVLVKSSPGTKPDAAGNDKMTTGGYHGGSMKSSLFFWHFFGGGYLLYPRFCSDD